MKIPPGGIKRHAGSPPLDWKGIGVLFAYGTGLIGSVFGVTALYHQHQIKKELEEKEKNGKGM